MMKWAWHQLGWYRRFSGPFGDGRPAFLIYRKDLFTLKCERRSYKPKRSASGLFGLYTQKKQRGICAEMRRKWQRKN